MQQQLGHSTSGSPVYFGKHCLHRLVVRLFFSQREVLVSVAAVPGCVV